MSHFLENWRCVESGFEDGPLNMATDEGLYQMWIKDQITHPLLRFYGFRPNNATFGVSQRWEGSKVLAGLIEEKRILTRRPTGGGIMDHQFDLCYSLVVDTKAHPDFSGVEVSYESIHQAIYAGFRHEGIELEFARAGKIDDLKDADCSKKIVKSDLLYQGRKVAGAAERRSEGYLLHQGSISLVPFVKNRIEYFNWFEKMRAAVRNGFQDRFGMNCTIGGLFQEEAVEIMKLKNEKYARENWNLHGEQMRAIKA